MPKNKKESLVFTIMMCFMMVMWMSLYNVSLHEGEMSLDVLKNALVGFPLAYVVAMLLDLIVVSKYAKRIAFNYFLNSKSSPAKKGIVISICMVIPMVVCMSLYGALEVCHSTGEWSMLPKIWLINIPLNFVMALPFQLLIAGPIVRKSFSKLFAEKTALD